MSVSGSPLEHDEVGNTAIHIAVTDDCAEQCARCPNAVTIVMLHCSKPMLRWDASFHLWHSYERTGAGKNFAFLAGNTLVIVCAMRRMLPAPQPRAPTLHVLENSISAAEACLPTNKYRLRRRVMPSTKVEQVCLSAEGHRNMMNWQTPRST